jgi:RNA-splicing ligase RtcB
LKASGLIVGDDKEIHFTNRAANIIKTMVLGEQNSFGKQSIKKPYSIILAEQLRPKRKSALALASKITDSQNSDTLKVSQSDSSLKNKKYYYNDRVISRGVASPTSNKEYNVRIYENADGEYELWIFWGRTDGTMQSKKEATYKNIDSAKYKAQDIINNKKYGPNEYRAAIQKGYSPVNDSIPGISSLSPTMQPKPNTIKKNKTPLKPYAPKPIEEKQKDPKLVEEKPKELSDSEKEQQRLKTLDEITDTPVDRSRLDELRKTLLEGDEDEQIRASSQFNLKKFNAKKKVSDVSSEDIYSDDRATNEIVDASPVKDVVKAISEGRLRLVDIKKPSPELAESLIRDRKTALGMGMRFIKPLLDYPNVSPETLEILSNLRKDLETGYGEDIFNNDLAKQNLKEVESKLLSRATGNEPWALKIQILHPPEDLDEIKSPILRKKYFDYLSQTRGQQLPKVEKSLENSNGSQWLEEKMELRKKLLEESDSGEELPVSQHPEPQPSTEKSGLGILEQKQQLRRNLLNEE